VGHAGCGGRGGLADAVVSLNSVVPEILRQSTKEKWRLQPSKNRRKNGQARVLSDYNGKLRLSAKTRLRPVWHRARLRQNYLLESRLIPIVRQERLASLNDLCARMRAEAVPTLSKQVVEAMTTTKLCFSATWRHSRRFGRSDPGASKITRRQQAVTFLVGGIFFRSGSLFAGHDVARNGLGAWNIEILGTDLSEQILERARQGKYMQLEVNRGCRRHAWSNTSRARVSSGS